MSSSLELPATTLVTCDRCGGQFTLTANQKSMVCQHCSGGLERSPNEEPSRHAKDINEVPLTSGLNNSSIFSTEDAAEGEVVVPSSIKAPDFRNWGNNPAADEMSLGSEVTLEESKTISDEDIGNTIKTVEEHSHPPQGEFPPSAPKAAQNTDAIVVMDSPRPIPRSAFWGLVIYSSIVTAICLGLLYLALANRRHQLESLPDVVPPTDEQGRIARELVPANALLPPGHTLKLGQTQRFGDVLVTPVKISREKLEFTHYQGARRREPADKVLKLWLKFENVSSLDKAFSPLDADLLFYRVGLPGTDSFKANNYLAVAGNSASVPIFAIYDHPIGSEWNLAEQQLGTVLSSGDSLITYLPSETGLPELAGQLVWRVHFRKGIAENGWGVTTLIDVTFSASQIHES